MNLRGIPSLIRDIAAGAVGASDAFVIDFTSVAQSSRSYDA